MIPVYYLTPPAKNIVEDLRSKLDPRLLLVAGDGEPVPTNTLVLIAGRPKRQHLLSAPKLQTLIIPWAGLPDVTRELMLDFPSIQVHNLHHNAVPVAEAVLAFLLAAAKYIVPLDQALRQGDWRPRYRPSQAVLLRHKTVLILGYGAIGREVAGFCRQLGMKVLVIKRTVNTAADNVADEIQPPSALSRLLPRAQVLIITLPHTPETDGLIGERELMLLPKGGVLVNVGRGPIVDEKALFQALQDGHLHSAGLDVWYNYPADEEGRAETFPASLPFHELDNVVLSPHRGGATTESNILRMEHLAILLNAAARGKPVPNRVDIMAGY